MLMLPLLILPFIIVLFALLGGGKGSITSSLGQHTGNLNARLPDPHFKKGGDKSKLSLYEEASKDSAIRQEKIKNDPYYFMEHHDTMLTDLPHHSNLDENETKIMTKLAQLKSVIHQKEETQESDDKSFIHSDPRMEQFEKLITKHAPENIHDPKMDQLNNMLDKVMAIQHPEILRDSLDRIANEHQEPVFSVKLNQEPSEPSTFGTAIDNVSEGPVMGNRFYDLSESVQTIGEPDNAIEAVIPETQTLVSGSSIKLRLLNDVRINGHLIEKNQFIYGTASLSNERLKIGFSSIRSGNNIFPVSLEAFDLDGLAGIFIPGSISRDAAKQSGDQAINSLGLAALDPSIGAQAAGAGIQAAKSLLSRKVKLVKVTIKAGYRLLLKDSKQK